MLFSPYLSQRLSSGNCLYFFLPHLWSWLCVYSWWPFLSCSTVNPSVILLHHGFSFIWIFNLCLAFPQLRVSTQPQLPLSFSPVHKSSFPPAPFTFSAYLFLKHVIWFCPYHSTETALLNDLIVKPRRRFSVLVYFCLFASLNCDIVHSRFFSSYLLFLLSLVVSFSSTQS